MFLSEGGHFYVDMHFYAAFFACPGKKMAIFMLLCTFMRYFLLTWTSAKKKEAALLRELLLFSVIFFSRKSLYVNKLHKLDQYIDRVSTDLRNFWVPKCLHITLRKSVPLDSPRAPSCVRREQFTSSSNRQAESAFGGLEG